MSTRVVLFNGPPRSGKDTGAHALTLRGWSLHRFSDPLKRAVPAFLGSTHEELEPLKDVAQVFDGLTYRDLQISLSEDWVKPMFGRDTFGRLLARAVQGVRQVVVPDSGFIEEFQALHRALPDAQFLVIQVYRKGCDYSNDSRGYLNPINLPLDRVDRARVMNNGSFHEYTSDVNRIVAAWERTHASEGAHSGDQPARSGV